MARKPLYVSRPGLRRDRGRYVGAQHLGATACAKRVASPVGVYWDDELGMIHSPEYIEVADSNEPEFEFIGLYDHDGDPLYREYERLPIGMHHHHDLD